MPVTAQRSGQGSMEPWLQVVLAIGVPALTGMTILAYRNPRAYRVAGMIVAALLAIAVVFSVIYNLGASHGYESISDLVPYEKIEQRMAARNDLYIPVKILAIFFGCFVYTIFLTALPELGISAPTSSKKDDE